MKNDRIFNFSAGPSMLPDEVLERAGKEILNYEHSGMSVMEMSHRSKMFQQIFDHTKSQFKKLMMFQIHMKCYFCKVVHLHNSPWSL